MRNKKPLSKVKLVKEASRANIGTVPGTKVKNSGKKLKLEKIRVKELQEEIKDGWQKEESI